MRVVLRSGGRGGSSKIKPVSMGRKRVSKNATMMAIGAPNPGGNKTAQGYNGKSKKFREYVVPLSRVNRTPALEKAIERWTLFQDSQPTRVRVFEYDDGKEGVEEHVCFRVGEAQITIDTVEDVNGNDVRIKPLEVGAVYKGEKNSNKSGKQWIHSFKEDGGKPPINVVDVETGIMSQIGGTYEALDWLRR